jgi:hypothetical protein
MLRDQEFLGWDDEGYSMVQGHVEFTTTSVPGVWSASTTLQSDVRLAYHNKRKLSESEESSRKLYDLLFAMSSVMGIWGEEEDEDI